MTQLFSVGKRERDLRSLSLFGFGSAVHFVADVGRSWSFSVLSGKSLVTSIWESSLRFALHSLISCHLVGFVVELVFHRGVLLRVVRVLNATVHLAVCLLVARELVWVNHRQHLGEALTNTSNSFCWITEWKLVPRHKLNLLSHHVDEVLLTGCTRESTEWFLAEHGILFVLAASLAHEQAVKVLELALVNL